LHRFLLLAALFQAIEKPGNAMQTLALAALARMHAKAQIQAGPTG